MNEYVSLDSVKEIFLQCSLVQTENPSKKLVIKNDTPHCIMNKIENNTSFKFIFF